MLVLSRRAGEKVVIGDDITITVIEVRGDVVRIGIDAPRSVAVNRWELLEELGRTGGIDLPGFWVRRARRLLPALIVVVMAVVVLREGEPSEQLARELQDHVKAETAPYKYPRIVEFADSLPKTASGKIKRAELRGGSAPEAGG